MFNYLIVRVLIESFRLIPFWLLYAISDLIRFVLFGIIKYRKKVIYENLEKAFPEKSKAEIRKIAHKFYKSFTDVLLEGIKGMTMSKESVLKRFKMLNPELLDQYFEKGQSVLSLGAHYCNWEWTASMDMWMKHETIIVYKAVKNPHLNKFIRESRSRWGSKIISQEKTGVIFRHIEKPKFVFLVADQSTSSSSRSIWLNFLGRDTFCLNSPEDYAKKFNFPVLYIDLQRVKRGHYTAELSLLSEKLDTIERGDITGLYMSKLEEIIRKKPEDWLWTHKRWKHKREDDKILVDYYYK